MVGAGVAGPPLPPDCICDCMAAAEVESRGLSRVGLMRWPALGPDSGGVMSRGCTPEDSVMEAADVKLGMNSGGGGSFLGGGLNAAFIAPSASLSGSWGPSWGARILVIVRPFSGALKAQPALLR